MSIELRTLVLRQAGLLDLSRHANSCGLSKIALIDGLVDRAHPAFHGCRISTVGHSRSAAACAHATFTASILVGSDAERRAGHVLALCAESTLTNFAVVTDEMLTTQAIRAVAVTLSRVVERAVEMRCNVILFGIEMRRPDSRDWQPLRNALRSAVAGGSVVVLPAGNRSVTPPAPLCCWPEALVVASLDWRGRASPFSPLPSRCGNTIFAPGENVPGAAPGPDFVVRSGTSFAAAIAAGAFGLAKGMRPSVPTAQIAAFLCPSPNRVLDATGFVRATATMLYKGGHHATAHAADA